LSQIFCAFFSRRSIAVLIVALTFHGFFYLKPKYQGELVLETIEKPTTVYFDEFGIPHYLCHSKDAMVFLGYVHAQDRLW
jgi:penicillin amidase